MTNQHSEGWEERFEQLKFTVTHKGFGFDDEPMEMEFELPAEVELKIMEFIAKEREAAIRGMVLEKRSCESYDGYVDDNCDECAGCRQNASRSEQIRRAKELGVSIEE